MEDKPEINCMICGRIPDEKEEFIETEDGFVCQDCAGENDDNVTRCCGTDNLDCDLQSDDQEEPLDY